MMVKICGITNREDALAAIDGGAAALGFNFYPASPRYIAPDEAAAVAATLPARVWKVGVFVDESPETVLRIAGQVGLDIAQLHGSESPQQYPRGMRVWKAIRMVGQDFSLPTAGPAEAVLVDGPASGRIFDWTRLRRPGRPPQAEGLPHVILAGGLDAGNVREAIEQVHPWGVDACSQLESSPGRKDRFKMAAFLKAALAASP
ncbi:MAG: phosphoribosylanthranilate isomerase [Bryobacteraceae bacterium]|jgi:phosphoribosylanthranilate isomerase